MVYGEIGEMGGRGNKNYKMLCIVATKNSAGLVDRSRNIEKSVVERLPTGIFSYGSNRDYPIKPFDW